jgi:hypothetical protein
VPLWIPDRHLWTISGLLSVFRALFADLEWYKSFYGAPLESGSSALDIAHLRRSLPAANCIRFVAL